MTTGPQEPAKQTGPRPENVDEVAAATDENIVEPETELASKGHDDRQVNPNDERTSDLAEGTDPADRDAQRPN